MFPETRFADAIKDVANKAEAAAIVPPGLRAAARVIGLNYFSIDQIDKILKDHQSASL